ncbi:MAG: TRAP transporter small permease subunit [Nitratireductor sp.]
MKILLAVRNAVEMVLVALLSSMVALTFVDVIGRRLFGKPVFGAHDITEHLMALTVFAGLPIVTGAAMHLSVDLLNKYIPDTRYRWWHGTIAALSAANFFLIAWLFFEHTLTAMQISDVSQALRIPRAPVYTFMGISCLLSGFAVLAALLFGPLKGTSPASEEEML